MYQINEFSKWIGETYAHPQWRKDADLFTLQKGIWSSRATEDAHGNPQQRKDTHCVQCQKSFGWARNLKTHIFTCIGEKTLTCSECEKSFGEAGNLREKLTQMPWMLRFIWSTSTSKDVEVDHKRHKDSCKRSCVRVLQKVIPGMRCWRLC